MTAFKNQSYSNIKNKTYADIKNLPYGLDSVNPVSYSATLILGIKAQVNSAFSMYLNVLPDNLVAVTSATGIYLPDGSFVNNPTSPTLILGGNIIYSNPESLPTTGVDKAQCYVSFDCSNIIIGTSFIGADGIFNWSININDQGGTFSTTTLVDYGPYGQSVSIFGLNATITGKGFNYSSSSAGFLNTGIMGSRNLNRELAFLVYGNPQYNPNTVNQYLTNPALTDLKTHQDAARLIADLAGVNISWHIPDFTSFTWQPQASLTGLAALSSLASECGGVIRWNGNNDYMAVFPNFSTGKWTIPDCCLIISAQETCTLDLNSGLYSPGVYMVPQLGTFNAGSTPIIDVIGTNTTSGGINTGIVPPSNVKPISFNPGSQNVEQVEARSVYRTVLTAASPVEYVPLPLDTKNIYVQNVIVSDPSGPYTTTDPNKWVVVAGNVTWSNVNGQLLPNLVVDSSWFPPTSNSDVSNNNWYMRIGISRYPAPQPAYVDTATGVIARNLLKYRFVPICTGSVSCVFFGSIPTQGMTLVANFNGKNLTGTIENISFTNPGIVTVNYVKWGEMEFYQQLGNSSNLDIPGFPG